MTGAGLAGRRRARKVAVPDVVRSHAAVERVDYQDAFAVPVDTSARDGAERWVRAVLDDAPAPLRAFLRFGWSLFGARLGPYPSPAHVMGWRIGENEPDHVRLEVEWTIGLRANLVLRALPTSVVLATFVQLDTRASRVLWPALIPLHQLILRYVLSRAARSDSSLAPHESGC
ncbi:hypothetical protein [Streptoalloteichus hindustanus]|uniref:DUF2867 domain-containing protein n=1 Tax=Streptoalloteichus hindustanus TaxID=2017 RepID=A0A1M5B7Q3_STRHI|nr:hypothetical protein [Streptoalloteichus hindustanus]SHF38478.1 hypothetical protein SAMN05444320_103437 [Streptoalloteichus hindustanus]